MEYGRRSVAECDLDGFGTDLVNLLCDRVVVSRTYVLAVAAYKSC